LETFYLCVTYDVCVNNIGGLSIHKILSILHIFVFEVCFIRVDLRIFFIGRFLGKVAVKWLSKIPPHLAYVATLPCETLMSAKQAINEKLQGNVATYLRCGGVVNNQIKNVYC